jgi:elongation factor G
LLQVDTPGKAQGDPIGDLNRRRGDIASMESIDSIVQLKAHVPLSELWGYANAIRSLSRGRASYSMMPSHFERVPEALMAKVIKKSK